ncbi:DUF1048 domain-containing protein [Lactococcus garvieae]|jgi:DNA-binding ferritin-like protein (Dps family)|uniref:DUF1048 domain-containing protein n=1 Tax=Lactococcus garvieae DCC43 TaxID=1231377 RepID=K2NSV2_9LACT|nr:DUF1048 domain-containing protein [Lactococcus garvieae]EKF50618.1 hypothetical protein C426_2054 [Lactococcus garvieae DCC43]QPS70334.1 DUF1048 domain-containing protein [Lactococcus garvieae]
MNLQEIIDGKKDWLALQAKVKKLPKDYYIVNKEIQKYFFKIGVTDTQVFWELLELFEDGAQRNIDVLQLTGDDVAAFSDSLLDQNES